MGSCGSSARAARPILRTTQQGADTFVWLAGADEPLRSSGRFWHDRRPRPAHHLPLKGNPRPTGALWDFVKASGPPA